MTEDAASFVIEFSDELDSDDLDVDFRLSLGEPLSPGSWKSLERLLLAWYELGSWGAYGTGRFHCMSDPINKEQNGHWTVEWYVDVGSADFQQGVDVLRRVLETFVQTHVGEEAPRIEKLIIGP